MRLWYHIKERLFSLPECIMVLGAYGSGIVSQLGSHLVVSDEMLQPARWVAPGFSPRQSHQNC